jgi:hypothetical protein
MSQMAAVRLFTTACRALLIRVDAAACGACTCIDGDGCSSRVDMLRRVAGCDERILFPHENIKVIVVLVLARIEELALALAHALALRVVEVPTTCDLCSAACESFVNAENDMSRLRQ